MESHPSQSAQASASLAVPASAHSMIVVGGSFNPVHLAHVRLPEQAREQFAGDTLLDAWLVYVPAGVSPFKALERQVNEPTPRQRADLVSIAIRSLRCACVWDGEIRAFEAAPGVPSYTIDTLRTLHALRPQTQIYLLIGTDQLAQLHRWKDARAILQLATPITIMRAPLPTAAETMEVLRRTGYWDAAEVEKLAQSCMPTEIMEVSSTQIRAALASGVSPGSVAGLDPAVAHEIKVRGWYRASS